jgi:hypothetical protein
MCIFDVFEEGARMGYDDYLRAERQRRKRPRGLRERRSLPLDLGDCLEVYLVTTRHLDLLVCHHRFSGRVHFTRVLPAGVWAEVTGQQRLEIAMSFLKRPAKDTKSAEQGVQCPADIRLNWPALGEYLFTEKYPDGVQRQRSTLTVMAGDAEGWKMVLNDRQENRSLWATGGTLEEAMMALEVALEAEHTPWRLDRTNGKPAPRK